MLCNQVVCIDVCNPALRYSSCLFLLPYTYNSVLSFAQMSQSCPCSPFQDGELLRINYSMGKYDTKQMGTKFMLYITNVAESDIGTYSVAVGGITLSARLKVIGKCHF